MSRKVIWLEGYIPPSLNTMLGQHWAKRYRAKYGKRGLSWMVRTACLEQGVEPDCDDKRKFLIVTVYKKKLYDDDNFIGGLKELCDVLKVHRFYADDDPDHLALKNPKQEYSKDRKGTEVIVEDAT